MDITFKKNKILTSTCSIEKYQSLTNDMTKDKNTIRYGLALFSLNAPDTKPF